MGNKEIENTIVTGKIEGKRERGKQIDIYKEFEQLDGNRRSGNDQSITRPEEMEHHYIPSLDQTWKLKKNIQSSAMVYIPP